MENTPPKHNPAQHQYKPTPAFENFGAFKFAGVKATPPPIQTKNYSQRYPAPFSSLWANSPPEPRDGIPQSKSSIRMSDRVKNYSTEATSSAHFAQALSHTDSIQHLRTRTSAPSTAATLIAAAVQEDMTLVIYGSNAIEDAGLGLDERKEYARPYFAATR